MSNDFKLLYIQLTDLAARLTMVVRKPAYSIFGQASAYKLFKPAKRGQSG